MPPIVEPARELPVIADLDVVVCGGGPGGLSAAIAAARHGARTLLIERYGFLGGMATVGLVAPILGHHARPGAEPVVEGLLRELVDCMASLGGATRWEDARAEWGIRFDAEVFKHVSDLMVQEAGVDLLLHTLVTGVVVEAGRIKAIVVENKSGRQAVTARIIIDATGDADVAFRAGAPTRQGRDPDGRVQSMGSFIHIGGLPELDQPQREAAVEKVRLAAVEGRLHFWNLGFLHGNAFCQDHASPNMTRWAGDPTDGRALTQAELDVRRDVWELITFLRAEVPGFEHCYLRASSPQVGARESRQIVGEYTLTAEDVRFGHKFADGIARGCWWIDIHCPLGYGYPVHLCTIECPREAACPYWAAKHGSMLHEAELYPPESDWYDVPHRCLLPRAIDNLLVAGRCISATHEGMAGVRVMGTCVAIGQAAGTAAAMAVRSAVRPRDLDPSELRGLLRADGALV